jgi:hypothetical protein
MASWTPDELSRIGEALELDQARYAHRHPATVPSIVSPVARSATLRLVAQA